MGTSWQLSRTLQPAPWWTKMGVIIVDGEEVYQSISPRDI